MNIKIFAVGKIKNINLSNLINIYSDRIKRFAKLEIIELKEFNSQDSNINSVKETRDMITKIFKYSEYYKILLSINSENISSLALADVIKNQKNYSNAKIIFIIGGSDGFDNSIIQKVDHQISFGKLTFPHQMIRLILLEQIYRSFKIIANQHYHK